MIHVSKLTKYYGEYRAIEDVTFEVAKGQVVGFLGPTAPANRRRWRILAGYLTAGISGSATIDGLDVFWKPVEVRRKIGYLPESCPLYGEMRVTEYLASAPASRIARPGGDETHRLRRRARCWLNDVKRQLVGTLSRASASASDWPTR